MLDDLTSKQRAFMFNLANPAYKSETARKINTNFNYKHNASPMVFSPDSGLVLYERVVTGQQETDLLNKLTKPKAVRAPVPPTKPTKPQQLLQQQQQSSQLPSWSSSTRPVSSRTGSGPGPASPALPDSTAATSAPSTSHASSATSATGSYVKRTLVSQKLSKEEQEFRDYYNRERATMTASHVFTWGGRFKYHGPEQGLSRQTWATGLHKPPLRL